MRRNGSPVTVGSSAGNIGVNYDTGIVTFVADASQSISSITTGSTTVVRFPNTTFTSQLSAGGRLYITGVTGTAATTLNNLSHAISAITANEILISTSTSGLTVTVAGTGFKYPQPADTLTWSGEFYVPVHFANDDIDWEVVVGGGFSGRIIAGPSVVLQEVRE